MVDQQRVFTWLKAGAVWKDGVLLFKSIFGKTHPYILLIKNGGSPLKYAILKQALALYAARKVNTPAANQPKLREDYPFLNDNQCPIEFKVLTADKITAFYNYKDAHEKLFDCETADQYYQVAAKVVENFLENRRIHIEFEHYAKSKKVLGKHPIFKILKQVEEFKKMRTVDLVKRRTRISNNIWRINSEIAKGDKPHLYHQRAEDIKEKEQLLIEIDRILDHA